MNRPVLHRVYFPAGLLFTVFFSVLCSRHPSDENTGKVSSSVHDSLKIYDSLIRITPVTFSDSIIRFSKSAFQLAEKRGDVEDKAYACFLSGIAFHLINPDSGYYYYDKALKLLEKINNRSRLLPQILYHLAMLYQTASDYKYALILLDSSRKLSVENKVFTTLSNCYNSIGIISSEMKDSSEARENLNKSLEIALKYHLTRQTGVALGNLALIQKDPDTAVDFLTRSVAFLKSTPGADQELGSVIINLALCISNPDSVIRLNEYAITIAEKGNLPEISIAAYNSLAYAYMDKNNIQKAEECLRDKAIPLAVNIKNNDWLSTLYDSYADVLKKKGNYSYALDCQKKAMRARNEANQQQATDQVRLLHALLKAKEKELQIKDQDEEIREKRSSIRQMYVWTFSLLLLIVLVITGSLFIIQRKNLKLKIQELENSKKIIAIEEKEHERISMQLHDMIGPLKTIILKYLDKGDFKEENTRKEINSILDLAIARIRQISHRLNPMVRAELNFCELIRGIIGDFHAISGIIILAELPREDLILSKGYSNHIYFILQEMLANAGKHSRAKEIKLSISQELNNLYIIYKDDGCGFESSNMEKQGLGLMHIFERSKLLGGNTELFTAPGKGVHWIISLPYENIV